MKSTTYTYLLVLLSAPVLAQELETARIAGTTTKTDTIINGTLRVADQVVNDYYIAADEKLSISFEMTMNSGTASARPEKPGLSGKLYLLATYKDQWYAKNTDQQWLNWNGVLATLPHFALKNNSETETVQVIDNMLLPSGEYQVYTGYSMENPQSGIVYNSQPLNFAIFDKVHLQGLDSEKLLGDKLRNAIRRNKDYESYLVNGSPPGSIYGIIVTTGNAWPSPPFLEPIATTPLLQIISREVEQGGVEQKGISGLFLLSEVEDNLVSISYSSIQEPITSPVYAHGLDIDLLSSSRTAKMFYYKHADSEPIPEQQSLIVVSTEIEEEEEEEEDDESRRYTTSLFMGDKKVFFNRYDEYGSLKDNLIVGENSYTTIDIIDATNPDAIKPTYRIKLNAQLMSSYQSGNMLYIVTRYAPYVEDFIHYVNDATGEFNRPFDDLLNKPPLQTLLPSITINDLPSQPLIKGENCYIPVTENLNQEQDVFTTITIFPLDNPEVFHSSCLMTEIDAVYGAGESIYLFKNRSMNLNDIFKFAYKNTGLSYKGATTFTGNSDFNDIQNNYYLDEYNDVLRIFSFSNPSTLSLIKQHETEQRLEKTSSITFSKQLTMDSNLIQFSGPRLVLFTREAVKNDPEGLSFYTEVYKNSLLKVWDLNDPYLPVELGRIKTNGYLFSLFPINERYMLGIGKAATPLASGLHGWFADYAHYQGIKLSLYDLTDQSSLGEVASITIGQRGTESALFFDAKAYAFTPETTTRPAQFAMSIALADTAIEYANFPGHGSYFDFSSYEYPNYLSSIEVGVQALSENEYYTSEYDIQLGPAMFEWTETGAYVFDIQTMKGEAKISLSTKLLATSDEIDIYYPHRHFIFKDYYYVNEKNLWEDRIILNNTGLFYRHGMFLDPDDLIPDSENYSALQ